MREPDIALISLCDDARARITSTIDEITSSLRQQLPSYSRLPVDEQRRTVLGMTELLFTRLANGVGPSADDLIFARRAARRRAMEGVSAYDVLATFNIVSALIWDALRASPRASDALLLDLVAPLNRWSRQMSEAVLEAVSNEPLNSHGHETALRERLFAELGKTSEKTDMIGLTHELSFDHAAVFIAVASPKGLWSPDSVSIMQRSARQLAGTVQFGFRGDRMLGLTQRVSPDELVMLITEAGGPNCRLGVGLARPGLTGAAMSIGDAERALRIALSRDLLVAHFADVWLEASVASNESRLSSLFAKARTVAASSPDLAAAVLAFSDGGFSLAGAARILGIHPNSVSYRLERWHSLTGLDPRTAAGFNQSVLALRISPSDLQEDADEAH